MNESARKRLPEGAETPHLTVESIIETYAGRLIEQVPHQDIPELIEERDILLAWWAERGLPAAVAAFVASPPNGCGFWLSVDGRYPGAAPERWFECVIPDADHADRDHILVLVHRAQLESTPEGEQS